MYGRRWGRKYRDRRQLSGPIVAQEVERPRDTPKEYVASLIGLYKNNGAVSCVGINFS